MEPPEDPDGNDRHKKNAASSRFHEAAPSDEKYRLDFRHCNGFLVADLHAAFATEAFFCVYRYGFFILHFENFHRTNIDALFAANAF